MCEMKDTIKSVIKPQTNRSYLPGSEIAGISYRLMDIPLKQPFRFATNTLTMLPYAWVRIETKGGTIGFGEAPTYWDPTGETQYAAIGAFRLWEDSLIGKSVFAVRDICRNMEETARGAYAARCAIETAVLDALAQIMDVPAVDLLGGVQNTIKLNAAIGLADMRLDTDGRIDEVAAKVDSGARVIKIKSSGASYTQDITLIKLLRERYGDSLTLFIDANQSWGDAYAAARRIDELSALGVSWIEQPIDAQDMRGQQYLVGRSPLPIMLDEGVMDSVSLANAITTGTVQYANLKLAKAGGPFSAMKFIDVAEANGVPYSIGSMVESGLGMLANYAVAQAGRPITCDFDAYSLVDDSLDVGFMRDGELLRRKDESKPGLGYDREQMERAFARGKTIN